MATADPEANGTSGGCDENKSVMASKSQLLQVVIHICHMSLHIKISGVLHAFRSFCSEAEARGNPKDIFDEVVRLLDDPVVSLKHPRISAPSGMFMDLMMYQILECLVWRWRPSALTSCRPTISSTIWRRSCC